MYAGYKIKNANPDLLLKVDGYLTSSNTIKNIIKDEGLESFKILDIIMEDDIMIPFGWNNIYAYESWFLLKNNCAKSDLWYNIHNNSSPIGMPDDSNKLKESRKNSVSKKYGVSNISQLQSTKDKKRETIIKNYGSIENWAILRNEKTINTCLIKYGTSSPNKDISVKLKTKNTFIQKYGVENAGQFIENRIKISARNSEQNIIPYVCFYCGKFGLGINMIRYHFNNCKNILSKDVNIPLLVFLLISIDIS